MDQVKCYICNSTVSTKGIVRHVKKCVTERYGKPPADASIPKQSTYFIKVQDKYQKEYSLYLLVDSCVLLSELDTYLRDIWLECCGHLSTFKIDGEEYLSHPDSGWGQEEGMDIEIGEVLYRETSATYTYDFGSSTDLTLKVIDIYEALDSEKGIRLTGRNTMAKYSCKFCDNEAIAMYENFENGDQGIVCNNCMRKVEEENEDIHFSDLINSPRAGVCGYEGPADDILFMKHIKSRKQGKSKKTALRSGDPKFMEEIISGNISAESQTKLDEMFSSFMKMEQYGSNSLPPYIIDQKKLKGENLLELLGLLNKNELDYIRKSHNIEKTSNIKKDALVKEVNTLLMDGLEEILVYMPTLEYITLLELIEEEEEMRCGSSEEIPEHILALRSMGMIYSVQYEKGKIKWVVPKELKSAIERFSSEIERSGKRELTERIESAIICIFFYWGIVTRFDLLKETSILLDMPMTDDFQTYFSRVFGYMSNSYIEKEIVGSMEIYNMFSEDPKQLVISESWQKAKYPEIPREALISSEKGGWLEFALQNPYFSLLYDIFTEIEEDKTDEDLNLEEAIDYLSVVTHSILNARPGTTIEQLGEELELTDNLKKSREFRSLINDMLIYSPNYWIKGNAVSGEVHLNSHIESANRNNVSNGNVQKATERAAERWKVGRNDPCPCGSGKKYKKCCM